ncbi:MAG: acetolactate synthase-1/2/3 large subunit [Akkermansiaceae bacterium]
MSGADATASGPIRLTNVTVAEVYLRLLKLRGIDYFFANAGTDFTPLIEAFAKGEAEGIPMPKPITAPHENIAVAMGMGYTLASGRPQAVMVHVNVGTANALCGVMNASRLQVPMLFSAGRTPVLEEGAKGSRMGFVHWPQEMRDQAGMVREVVRWDYELRDPRQVVDVVDRALAMCQSTPAGPIYLTLPREVLASTIDEVLLPPVTRLVPATAGLADASALSRVVDWLSEAERPLIITSMTGRTKRAKEALEDFCATWAIPVVAFNPRFVEVSADHPMNVGGSLSPWLEEADLVLVSETVAPWVPNLQKPPSDAKVVQIGPDPLSRDLPMRSFPSDATLQGDTSAILTALIAAAPAGEGWEARRARVAAGKPKKLPTPAFTGKDAGIVITPAQITAAVAKVCKGSVILREGPLNYDGLELTESGSFFFAGAAGGLGWSLGTALGISLANGHAPVVVGVGDGSYMFGTPLAAHFVAAEQGIPLLTLVLNNQGWHAVRRATRGMYKDGYAAAAQPEPLTDFGPDMAYEKMMDVVGGFGQRVERPEDLCPALETAMAELAKGRQALLNILCTT